MDVHRLAASKFAAIVGRRLRCKVVFVGDRMACSKDTIYFPNWDLSDSETYQQCVGLAYHEGGHARFDDFDTLESWLNQKPSAKRSLLQTASNILADVRLEHHQMHLYPGAKFSLDAIARRMLERTPVPDYSDNNAIRVFLDYALFDFRLRTLGQSYLEPKRDAIAAEAIRLLGTKALERMEEIRERINHIGPDRSEYPALLSLAEDLVQILDDLQEESENASDPDDGSPDPQSGDDESEATTGSDDGDGDGDDQGDDQTSSGDDTSQEGASQAADGNSDQQDGDHEEGDTTDSNADTDPQSGDQADGDGSAGSKASDDAASGNSTSGSDPSDGEQTDAPSSASSASANDADGPKLPRGPRPDLSWSEDGIDPADYDVATQLADQLPKTDTPYEVSFSPFPGAGYGGECLTRRLVQELSDAAPLVRSLRSSLHDFVQTHDLEESTYGRTGRTIASNRVSRIFGDGRAFRRRAMTETESVHVALLVDFSGSTDKINGALAVTTIALSKALDALDDVERSIYGFPASGSNLFELVAPKASEASIYDAWPTSFGWGTPLYGALLDLVPLLLQSDKDRRVVLCITDGQPDNGDRQRALSALRRCGIEFYGVVIGCRNYDLSIFDASRAIGSVSELPAAVKALSREILQRRPQAA